MQATDKVLIVTYAYKTASKPLGISAAYTGHQSSVEQTSKTLTQNKGVKVVTINHTADSL